MEKLRLEYLEDRRLRGKLNKPFNYFETKGIGFGIPTLTQSYFDDPSLIFESDLIIASEQLKNYKKLKTAKFSITTLERMHMESLNTIIKLSARLKI
jgi:hypothetical protein